MIHNITSCSPDEIRPAFREYLASQSYTKSTIDLTVSDAFYIWRKQGHDAFWRIVRSDDFETLGKATLLELLEHQPRKSVGGYMSALRRFKRFTQACEMGHLKGEPILIPDANAKYDVCDPFLMQSDPYSFDVDKNGILALTEQNIKRIKFILDNDSNYRSDMDAANSESTYNYIRKHGCTLDYAEVLRTVEKIDIQNSTHQASAGIKKGANNGREKTAEFICAIPDFYERIKNEDGSLVNELACAIDGRYTFSFASKYCTYVSRYLFDADGYSIYDKILCDILPYYAWAYIGENHMARKQSRIPEEFGKKNQGDYIGYRNLIDRIRIAAKNYANCKEINHIQCKEINREDFDHLLWYYYKGDSDIIEKQSGTYLHKSRITTAIEFVGDPRSRLWA